MPAVCFYFQVHQPYRVKRYRVFDVGHDHEYFNDESDTDLNNGRIIRKVASKCYQPANALLLELLERHPEFKVSFSLSGVLLEQLKQYSPETLDSFRRLVDTGQVAILGETYHHSLAFFYSLPEFEQQVALHRAAVKKIFGVTPRVFRNTELAYNNNLGLWADKHGYEAVLAEGWDRILGWRSPNFVYRPKGAKRARLLLKNYKLSDDVAFRFSEKSWSEWPLTAPKFSHWVSAVNGTGDIVNLFMDYETFGEHQWEDTGIFNFLRHLPQEVLKNPDNSFITVEEAARNYPIRDEVNVPEVVTWADTERDLSAWTGNDLQTSALRAVYDLESPVAAANDSGLLTAWRRLTTSDHFYYMCTKWFADGDVHAYFNPYRSPYEAFIAFINATTDLRLRLGVDNPTFLASQPTSILVE
ncbi:MAG TPA: glycoside hydrolase family 57 protein [Candidatus Paceibacterota bacterium]